MSWKESDVQAAVRSKRKYDVYLKSHGSAVDVPIATEESLFDARDRVQLESVDHRKRLLLKAQFDRIAHAYGSARQQALSAPENSYQQGTLTSDVVHVLSSIIQSKLDKTFTNGAYDDAATMGLSPCCTSDAQVLMEQSTGAVRLRNDLELVSKEWEESYMRRPTKDEQLCSRGRECEGVRLIEKELLPGIRPEVRGHSLVRFLTPEEASGARQERSCGLCVLCLRRRVTETFYESLRSGKPQSMIIQPYRVAVRQGEYSPDVVFSVNTSNEFSGFSDPFPKYSLCTLEWNNGKFTQVGMGFSPSVAHVMLRVFDQGRVVRRSSIVHDTELMRVELDESPLIKSCRLSCTYPESVENGFKRYIAAGLYHMPCKFMHKAWRVVLEDAFDEKSMYGCLMRLTVKKIPILLKILDADWDPLLYGYIVRQTLSGYYPGNDMTSLQQRQYALHLTQDGTKLRKWIETHVVDFRVCMFEALRWALVLDETALRHADAWWRDSFMINAVKLGDALRKNELQIEQMDASMTGKEGTRAWKQVRAAFAGAVLPTNVKRYTWVWRKFMSNAHEKLDVDHVYRVDTRWLYDDPNRFELSLPEAIDEDRLARTISQSMAVRSFNAPVHWTTDSGMRQNVYLFCPTCKSLRSSNVTSMRLARLAVLRTANVPRRSKRRKSKNDTSAASRQPGKMDEATLMRSLMERNVEICSTVGANGTSYDIAQRKFFCFKPTRTCPDSECFPIRLREKIVEFYGSMLIKCRNCGVPTFLDRDDPSHVNGECGWCTAVETQIKCVKCGIIKKSSVKKVWTCVRVVSKDLESLWYCPSHAPPWWVNVNHEVWSAAFLERTLAETNGR